MTALHWATQHGHHNIAELLIKHGADVHALSKFDKSAFDIAVDIQHAELIQLLQVCCVCGKHYRVVSEMLKMLNPLCVF